MTIQITVLGLGQVGTSIGLALAAHKDKMFRLGNDREPEMTRKAEKMGAFDKTGYNLPAAVEKADVVILALPVDDIRMTLEIIAPVLKDGCVVLDTSPVQVAMQQMARELMPEGRHFVSMTPTFNPVYLTELETGIEAAHADLFKDGLMIITSAPGTDADAIKLAADMTTLLEARPMFADPYEADGLLAAVRALPVLAAAALVNATINQPGWREARKAAGKHYSIVTLPATDLDERTELGHALLLNRENSLRMVDALIDSLSTARKALAENDAPVLKRFLEGARDGRTQWLAQRYSGDWDAAQRQPLPTAGEIFGRLFGFGRRPKDQERK